MSVTEIVTPVCQTYSSMEAARILGVSRPVVKRMVDNGLLPNIDTGTNRIVIPKWAVDQLVAPPTFVTVALSNADLVAAATQQNGAS